MVSYPAGIEQQEPSFSDIDQTPAGKVGKIITDLHSISCNDSWWVKSLIKTLTDEASISATPSQPLPPP